MEHKTFLIAYEEYLKTANETAWKRATDAARTYAELADPSADWRHDGDLQRQMARIAQEKKPAFLARCSGNQAQIIAPKTAAPLQDDFFSPKPVDTQIDVYTRVVEGMKPGEWRVAVFENQEDTLKFQQRMSAIAERLGWRKAGDDKKAHECETLKQADAYYVNGSTKRVYLLRIMRLR